MITTVEVSVQRRFVISLSEQEARYLLTVAEREQSTMLAGLLMALKPHFVPDRIGG